LFCVANSVSYRPKSFARGRTRGTIALAQSADAERTIPMATEGASAGAGTGRLLGHASDHPHPDPL
jgi:hypothetical protein